MFITARISSPHFVIHEASTNKTGCEKAVSVHLKLGSQLLLLFQQKTERQSDKDGFIFLHVKLLASRMICCAEL